MSGHGIHGLPLRTLRRAAARAAVPPGTHAAAAHDDAVEAMLSRLVTRMRSGGFAWPGADPNDPAPDDNAAIPAGYTYLAQFVAHDFVENTAQLPRIDAFPGPLQRDFRVQRLLLDTLYGGGPGRDPLPYAVASGGSDERCLFRLGHVRGREPQPFEPAKPPLTDQPARDIARARCPFLTDRPDARATPDALVADARNDQHLVISQLTALFLELHNIVFAVLRRLQDAPPPDLVDQLHLPRRADFVSDAAFRHAQADMAFLQTRKLMAFVYRRIVVQDLLRRLLEPGVWSWYTDPARRFPAELLDPATENRVPLAFSHAVFRFGHVMSRFSYRLNDTLADNPSITDLLDRSSARRRDLLPLASNWLVDWSHFFDLGDGKPVNASRRIGPFVAQGPLTFDGIVPEVKDRDGGLFYRDFVRGREAGVASVADMIARLRPSERDRSDLLANANFREHEIGRWLTHASEAGFKPDELVSLSKDPPLLLFVLFEAAHQQDGRRLGILGSTIIADVFFQALKQSESVIELDPAVPILAGLVFGAQIPSDMPSVIGFMKAKGGLADVVFDPSAPTT